MADENRKDEGMPLAMGSGGYGGGERTTSQEGGDQSERREQQAGEGGTTRFGMEDGDNAETPATGGVD